MKERFDFEKINQHTITLEFNGFGALKFNVVNHFSTVGHFDIGKNGKIVFQQFNEQLRLFLEQTKKKKIPSIHS